MVPNFLSDVPPSAPWAAVDARLARFFGLHADALTENAEARDQFAETLRRLHVATTRQTPLDVVALAVDIAKKVRARAWKRRALERAYVRRRIVAACGTSSRARQTTETTDEKARMRPIFDDRVEASIVHFIDDGSGPKPLTAAFDRAELWTAVHDLCTRKCRERFGRVVYPASGSTMKELADTRVDGRRLAPEELAWIDLLGVRSMPAKMKATTTTTPDDIIEAARERAKKTTQRTSDRKRRGSSAVSPTIERLAGPVIESSESAA